MSTGPNRILDELAKLMTDAAGAAQGVRREVETAFKSQAEKVLNSMDVVQREEFEAVRDMALKARAENKRLAARIDALEAASGATAAAGAEAAAPLPRQRPLARNNSRPFPQARSGGNALCAELLTGLRQTCSRLRLSTPHWRLREK